MDLMINNGEITKVKQKKSLICFGFPWRPPNCFFTLEETFPEHQRDACSADERLLPVSIGGHSALDDDDLPRVQASRYGPCVRDRLGAGARLNIIAAAQAETRRPSAHDVCADECAMRAATEDRVHGGGVNSSR